jgi:hypothetical protein
MGDLTARNQIEVEPRLSEGGEPESLSYKVNRR